MIRRVLFGNGGWDQAKRALDAGAERQRALASNIANAGTPGYRAQEVAFEEMLRAEKSRLPMDRTQPGHLAGRPGSSPAPLTRLRGGEIPPGSINDVEIEREMNEMVQNTVHFQALTQFLANRYRGLRDAIRPGS